MRAFCWPQASLPMVLLGSGSRHLGAAVGARAQLSWLCLSAAQGLGAGVPVVLCPSCPGSSQPVLTPLLLELPLGWCSGPPTLDPTRPATHP